MWWNLSMLRDTLMAGERLGQSPSPKSRGEPEGSDYEYKKHRVCFLSEDLPQIYQFGKKFAAVVDAYDAKDFFHMVFYGIFTDEKTFGNIPV